MTIDMPDATHRMPPSNEVRSWMRRHIEPVVIGCARWRLAGYDPDRHRASGGMIDPVVRDLLATVADILQSASGPRRHASP